MIVKKIDIENYKGFEKQEIAFEDNLNVFIGANASGKTSLLEAVVKCLYQLVKYIYPELEYKSKLLINDENINYGKTYSNIISNISYPEIGTCSINIHAGEINQESNHRIQSEAILFADQLRMDSLNKGVSTFPIIKYYPTNRGKIENNTVSLSRKIYIRPQFEVWENIYQDDNSYSRFLNWFFEYETQELRLKRDSDDFFSVESPHLKYVRQAVEKALYVVYDKKYIIKSNRRAIEGSSHLIPTLSLKLKNDTAPEEDIDSKSDGEKAIISLVADIAYNLSLAHDFNQDEEYLNAPGIVLIDEIEAHLHPNWQRKIISILISVFPKIQFFITTHSPQVISSVNSKNIFLCDNFNIEKVNLKTKGVDSNTLLKFLFNATDRPKPYIDLLNNFEEIIDNQGNTEDLENIIKKIAQLEDEDTGNDISGLVGELRIRLEAYKFELEHEVD